MDALHAVASRPDSLPVLLLIPLTILLLVMWWRLARTHDRLLDEGGEEEVQRHMDGPAPAPVPGEPLRPRVHSWPYLVRIELLAALCVMLALTVWSILVDAPLSQMADLSSTPNPSKAPWYFVGLQEMLVYFDPWFAGVMLPSLIVLGLCAIPYLDVNPAGNGYYCFRPRRFAISTFMFGLVGLWIVLIMVGVFCRGPGWRWTWPWEPWLPLRGVDPSSARNWHDLFGVETGAGALVVGGLTVLVYYGTALLYWAWRRGSPSLVRLGGLRYAVVAFLLLTMLALPIKIALRVFLSIKYVWVTPWFNV